MARTANERPPAMVIPPVGAPPASPGSPANLSGIMVRSSDSPAYVRSQSGTTTGRAPCGKDRRIVAGRHGSTIRLQAHRGGEIGLRTGDPVVEVRRRALENAHHLGYAVRPATCPRTEHDHHDPGGSRLRQVRAPRNRA